MLPTTVRCFTVTSLSPLRFTSFSSIHLHWNLQALTITGQEQRIILPSEIWERSQIRRIQVYSAELPDPPVERKETILENLHTLSNILVFKLTGEVLKRIPNIKKLGITCYETTCSAENIASLSKLESLFLQDCCICFGYISFPQSLKKLTLFKCTMDWEHMSVIGSLPNLEALKLIHTKFTVSVWDPVEEWNPVEGEFLRLKYLFMDEINLVWWRAEDIHFPCLERLELHWMKLLEEIPSGIGDIPTLGSIHLIHCSDKVKNSAKEIIEEQRSKGNDLQLFIK